MQEVLRQQHGDKTLARIHSLMYFLYLQSARMHSQPFPNDIHCTPYASLFARRELIGEIEHCITTSCSSKSTSILALPSYSR